MTKPSARCISSTGNVFRSIGVAFAETLKLKRFEVEVNPEEEDWIGGVGFGEMKDEISTISMSKELP